VETVDLVPALVHGQHVKMPDLRSGDLITIPVNQDNFSILGYVKTPGSFPIPQGKTFTLADAVSAANGQSKDFDMRARLSQVRVAHKEAGGEKLYTYNLSKYLSKGDVTQNPNITAGDIIFVPETNQVSAPTLAQILEGVGLGYYFGVQH
jgi:protein involved in polysaccharide export with SLBB domain